MQHLVPCGGLDAQSLPAIIRHVCAMASKDMVNFLPLLGFLLRSTNVRNAFELCGPLSHLARQLLGQDTRLVLSSEWSYSPLTYGNIPHLPGFVLIGLPASESHNPLLVPLAGHELGHAVWRVSPQCQALSPIVKSYVLSEIRARWNDYQRVFPQVKCPPESLDKDLFAVNSWAPAATWAEKQAQESFCDFVGVRLFGHSYMHAFAYLLSPNWAMPRTPQYPPIRKRVQAFLHAASVYSVTTDAEYESLFEDQPSLKSTPEMDFQIAVADASYEKITAALVSAARDLVEQKGIPLPSVAVCDRICCRDFRLLVPARGAESLANIVNAGWAASLDDDLWKEHAHVHVRKHQILNELILKSIEILEIERRTSVNGAAG
jgi:hypothetical protein